MRLIIVLLALSSLTFGSPEPGLPRQLRFEENRGQAASATSGFRTVGGRYVAEISERAIGLGDGVRLVFAGARSQAKWRPDDRVWTNRYLLGSERRQWIPEVPVYAKLRRDDLYPGIGIVLYGAGRDLEYDLVLAPGADPGQVRLRFEGARAVRQLPGGTLRVESVAGEAWEQRLPEIFQTHGEQRRLVQGRFVARGDGEFGLELAAYQTTVSPSWRVIPGRSALAASAGAAATSSSPACLCRATPAPLETLLSSVDRAMMSLAPSASRGQPASGSSLEPPPRKIFLLPARTIRPEAIRAERRMGSGLGSGAAFRSCPLPEAMSVALAKTASRARSSISIPW